MCRVYIPDFLAKGEWKREPQPRPGGRLDRRLRFDCDKYFLVSFTDSFAIECMHGARSCQDANIPKL